MFIANAELIFQNEEKEKRAAELIIANRELLFQNEEKEKRAAELIVANEELVFQNREKEKRAAELLLANVELLFQNEEKEKRAAELLVVNTTLLFQHQQMEEMTAELTLANKELVAFTYIASHDLQEPLRKIQTFVNLIIERESQGLTALGADYFRRIRTAASRMQQLIDDLLSYSRTNTTDHKFEQVNLNELIEEVKLEMCDLLEEKNALVEHHDFWMPNIVRFQFRQLIYNLFSNTLKFSKRGVSPLITICCETRPGAELKNEYLLPETMYNHICFTDNGIGFDLEFKDRIFEVFQQLHNRDEYSGTGIGLAIVKKIVDNHHGFVTAWGGLNEGAKFDLYIPVRVPDTARQAVESGLGDSVERHLVGLIA